MIQEKKKFSGWGVIIGCIILMLFPGGLMSYTAGLFMYPICAEFGFSFTTFSITMTLAAGVNAFASAFLVSYLNKGSKNTMKILMLISLVIVCVGFAVQSLCTELWQFYMMSIVWNIGYCMLTHVPVSMIISNWFVAKRSTMIGIAFAGGNLGGAIFNAVISRIIFNEGWRMAYIFGGGISFIFCFVAIVFLLKRSPSEYGQRALGSDTVQDGSEPQQKVWFGVDKKAAMKSPAFFIACGMMMLTGICAAGIANHVVNYLCTGGWNITDAGLVMTVFTLAGIAGNIGGGAIVGKVGIKTGVLISTGLLVIAIIFLIFATSIPIFAYAFAISLGLCSILFALIPSLAISNTFGVKDFAGIYGASYAFYLVGCAISSPLIAAVAESLGYITAWIAVVAMAAMIAVLHMRCIAYGKKFKVQYPD